MERTHTFPEMAGSAINADVIMGDELAADVAEEGGNAGRHGKRGRRSNKELLPAPAEKRKAAALGESLPTVLPLYFPFIYLIPFSNPFRNALGDCHGTPYRAMSPCPRT